MTSNPNDPPLPAEAELIFARTKAAYDLLRMQLTRIIAVGCGGARSFLEDKARCGVGQFVLLDPDIVEKANIATQQVFLEDIGRAKVDCIRDRILQINPDALVEVYQQSLDDVTDTQLGWLIDAPLFFPWL